MPDGLGYGPRPSVLFLRKNLKSGSHEPALYDAASDGCLAFRIAHAIGGMRIAELFHSKAVNKVTLPVNPHRQIAAIAFQTQFARPASGGNHRRLVNDKRSASL